MSCKKIPHSTWKIQSCYGLVQRLEGPGRQIEKKIQVLRKDQQRTERSNWKEISKIYSKQEKEEDKKNLKTFGT